MVNINNHNNNDRVQKTDTLYCILQSPISAWHVYSNFHKLWLINVARIQILLLLITITSDSRANQSSGNKHIPCARDVSVAVPTHVFYSAPIIFNQAIMYLVPSKSYDQWYSSGVHSSVLKWNISITKSTCYSTFSLTLITPMNGAWPIEINAYEVPQYLSGI